MSVRVRNICEPLHKFYPLEKTPKKDKPAKRESFFDRHLGDLDPVRPENFGNVEIQQNLNCFKAQWPDMVWVREGSNRCPYGG